MTNMQRTAPDLEVLGRAAFRQLDVSLARLLARLDPDGPPAVPVLAALTSCATQQGHICVDIEDLSALAARLDIDASLLPSAEEARAALSASANAGPPGTPCPLIHDGTRLYLHRLHRDEAVLAERLLSRAQPVTPPPDFVRLRAFLDQIFPDADENCWQRAAVFTAATRRLCVLTGGPGTGKTTTMVRVVSALLHLYPQMRVALCAPTGKAAARMMETIVQTCDDSGMRPSTFPSEATTIHRLLGARPGGEFRHGADAPLPHDLVVVDEASMVDMPLMARLVESLPHTCRLVVLGDRNQLASVQAGAVLGDICHPEAVPAFTDSCIRQLAESTGTVLPQAAARSPTPLADTLVELQTVHRYHGSLETVSRAVNAGDAEGVLQEIDQSDTIHWHDVPERTVDLQRMLEGPVLNGFRGLCEAATPEDALAALDRFRVLCALRRGPAGVESINAMIERILVRHGMLDVRSPFYEKRPVLVTRNDHTLGVYNGDIGIVMASPEGDPAVCFRAADSIRRIAPHRLEAVETAFAMTVHKSQGSEFERLLLLLPGRDSPVLTRELVYTGLTRARTGADIVADRDVFAGAVSRSISRSSGLAERLWG